MKQILIIFFILMVGCNPEEFGVSSQSGTVGVDPIATYQKTGCAASTLIKPPVDILFLVDNSASVYYLNDTLRQAMANTLTQISDDYDYRAMVAPLISISPTESLTNFPVVANTPITSTLVNYIGTAEQIASNIQPFSSIVGGASEPGVKRAIDIINANHRQNAADTVFRKGAYTHVVILSNGDDNEAVYSNGYLNIAATNALQEQRVLELKKFTRKFYDTYFAPDRGLLLRSEEFRFVTIVAHSNCGPGMIKGTRYMDVSRQTYNYVTNSNVTTGGGPDSIDICNSSLDNVFAQVSANIQQVIVPHVYNWWPVATTNTFDTTQIRVIKSTNAGGTYECTRDDMTNGFVYHNTFMTNKETRESPLPPPGTLAEPYTGYLIEMFGQCKVTFPECIYIDLQDPPSYRGYIVFDREPSISTIRVFKAPAVNPTARVEIPQNATNGWTYIGTFSGNIMILAPGNFNNPMPPSQAGYAVRLNGTAAATNGDILEYYFDPLGN